MSQVIFDTISPADSGTELADILNDFKDALVSGLSGTSRPTELQAGGSWIDTTNDPTSWSYKLWTGVDDIEVFVIDLVSGAASVSLAVDSFIVRKVSADTVGAILNLVKRRIATNGQVLSGDTVAEVRMVGRDSSGGDPIVAKIVFVANENETSSAFGGTLSFYSTPLGQSALVEHMRFIAGVVETIVPLKINAQVLVSQNVSTTATIAQLSADKVVAEMTGSTATSIQGLNSAGSSKVVTIHNRSSASVTLKNQDLGATAADRLLLPESKDIVLLPQDSATLYYCTTDTRWKVQYASSRFTGFQTDTVYGDAGSWVAPSAVTKVRIAARAKSVALNSNPGSMSPTRTLDVGKNLYAWGINTSGEVGVGDVLPRSSPVAVLGGLRFIKSGATTQNANSSFGLTEGGVAYTWGNNAKGQLGVGDIIPRSSPVAVVGGLKYKTIVPSDTCMYGLGVDGTLYAWGLNTVGELGVGDVVARSSPVAVLGGLKFRELVTLSSSFNAVVALTFDGTPYAWGYNDKGQLGVGDVTPRSSPVAVLGGLKFKTLGANGGSVIALTEAGDAYAWGSNTNGELGVGNTVARSSPVAVLGGLKFKLALMSMFNGSALGLTEDDVLYAWGSNTAGELGVGDVVKRSSPVAVLGGLKFKTAAFGVDTPSFTCSFGLTEDGTLYAWGGNGDGCLGVGDVVKRSSPVAVLGGLTFQEIYVSGTGFSTGEGNGKYGLTVDGALYAWGANGFGGLGVGDIAARSSPVAVLSGLSLRTQDDSDTILDIAVVGGDTYSLKLGAGPCFFGSKPIGNNIQKVEITYVP